MLFSGLIGWQVCFIGTEREIYKVQLQGVGEVLVRAKIIGPVGSIDKIQALFGDCGGLDGQRNKLVSLCFGPGVQPSIGDLGNDHVAAGSPTQGFIHQEEAA